MTKFQLEHVLLALNRGYDAMETREEHKLIGGAIALVEAGIKACNETGSDRLTTLADKAEPFDSASVHHHAEFPPMPEQLLWMFDASDRKEATRMIHDYAKTCVTARLAKPLREAWERAQKAEDGQVRLRDQFRPLNAEIERAHQKIIDLRNAMKKLVYAANTFDGTGNTEAKLQATINKAKMMIAEGDPALQDDNDYTPNDNSTWAPRS